jgi:hypothetical protein
MLTLPHERAVERPSEVERPDVSKFSALMLQLAAVVWVANRFQIESKAFRELLMLTVAGFAIHYFLPLRHRLPFFLLLSVAGIVLVLGPVQAGWLLAVGLALVGLAHLPIRFGARVGLLLAVGALLFLARPGRFDVPWSAAVWPILASMFMFRMIVYMYDLGSGLGQATVAQRLSYFFLLPNVCFPLFPVVDFRTFVRNYYNGPRHEIHQVGVEWIVRGMVQLLLYRAVQVWLAISPYDVDDVFSLAHYFIWLYLLYLIISGQFHVIVGMLHLFGFNLPETHRRYYLASSFTDFWRRINIYWKDFMTKVFFNPIFFRLRRLGQTPALVLSIAAVFVLTWALHAYQGYWIRGFFHFSWNDTLFWAILGVLVILNSIYESRYGRRRSLTPHSREASGGAVLVLKTSATFAAMCVLWAFWSSESLSSWLSLWPAAAQAPSHRDLRVLLELTAAGIVAVGASAGLRAALARWPAPHFGLRGAVAGAWLAGLAVLSLPVVQQALGTPGSVLASISVPRLNAFQLEELERGYYEDLLTVDRFNRELGSLYAKRPPDWEQTLTQLGIQRPGAPPGDELTPNAEAPFKGTIFRTNRWGMHDKDYAPAPAPGTYRIALLGASHVMGWGVPREATFEAVLEERLNRHANGRMGHRIEVLNFSFMNLTPFDQIELLERKVAGFRPAAVWYVGHPYELKRVIRHIRRSVQEPGADPRGSCSWCGDLARRAGVNAHTSTYLAERRLARFGDEIFSRLYGTMVGLARRHGMQAVYVHLPLTPESRNEADETPYIEIARRAGFSTVDLTGVYDGYPREAIWIAEWDAHPNALGHRLVADRLWTLIQQNGALLPSDPVESAVHSVTINAN